MSPTRAASLAGDRRRRVVRALFVLLLALLALEGAYCIAANQFLRSATLVRLLNRKPEKLQVEWARAWTAWPGRVHVTDLRIRGQNRHNQWLAAAPEADLTIGLLSLGAKQFRASHVRARGFTFLLGARLDRHSGRPLERDWLPVIPGLANPPSPAPEQLYPPPTKPRPWLIWLRDIEIEEVSQIWINELNYEGDGTISGDLRFHLRRELEVEHGTIELKGGAVRVGGQTVAEGLDARLSGVIEPFALGQRRRAVEVFARLTAELELTSPSTSLAFIAFYTRGAPWLSFEGRGPFSASLAVEHGRFTTGSHVHAETPAFRMRWPPYEASGAGTIEGRVAVRDGSSAAELSFGFEEVAFTSEDDDAPFAMGGLELLAVVHDPILGTGFEQLELTAELEEARVTSFEFLDYHVPRHSGLDFVGGSGSLAARFELRSATRSGRGGIDLVGEDVGLNFHGLRLRGDLRARGRLQELPPDASRGPAYAFDVGGSYVELDNVQGGERNAPVARDWQGRLVLEQGTVQVGDPWLLRAAASAVLEDSRPIVALFAEKNRFIELFEGLLAVKDVSMTAELTLEQALELENLAVRGHNMELEADLRFAEAGPEGILFARYGPVTAGVLLADGTRNWKLLGAREWFEQQRLERRAAAGAASR